MRLYSRTDAVAIDAPEGHFGADEDGGFDLPDELGQRLHPVAVGGRRQWETDIERQHRQIAEEIEHRRSPEALYEAVSKLIQVAGSAPAKAPAAKAPAKAAAKS